MPNITKLTEDHLNTLRRELTKEDGSFEETEDERKIAKDYLDMLAQPYMEQDRDESDGPRRINTSLKFMEDVYAVSYIYQLKRKYIEDDFSDVDEDKTIGDKLSTSTNEKDDEKRRSRAKSYTDARVTLRGRFLFMFLTQMILVGLLFFE